MNTTVYDFQENLTPSEFLTQYGRQIVAQRRAGEGVGGWVHKQLRQFNDPKRGVAVAMQARKFMEKMVEDFIQSANFKAIDGVKKSDYKLTGNGTLANAVKRITTAMHYGADLVNPEAGESYCPTMSQCRKFSDEAIKNEKSELTAQKLRQVIEMDVEMEGNLVRGTDAFKEEVDKRFKAQNELIDKDGGNRADGEEEDAISVLADKFESALRQYAGVMTEEGALETGEAKVRSILEAIQKIVKNAGERSGFVTPNAA